MAKLLQSVCRYSADFQRRYIWRSVVSFDKQSIEKIAARRTERYMKKTIDLLNGSKSSKARKYNFPLVAVGERSQFSAPSSKPQNVRRARQLSVVFHEYISGMISTGEVCPELLNLGFEIVKVQMLNDLSAVNVHWLACGDEKDEAIVALLPRCAAELRSTLTGLRLMGHVPHVQFCKDLTSARLRRVEELLKIADMGPDVIASENSDDEIDVALPIKAASQNSLNQDIQQITKSFRLEFKPDDHGYEVASDLCHAESGLQPGELFNKSDDPGEFQHAKAKNRQYVDLQCAADEIVQLNLRSDLYGVPRDELTQKITHAKKKLQSRSSQAKNKETDEVISTAKNSDDLQQNTKIFVAGAFTFGNQKKDRLYRNADSILSSRHHQDVDDMQTEDYNRNSDEYFSSSNKKKP